MRVDKVFPGVLNGRQLRGWGRKSIDRARFVNHTGVDIREPLLHSIEENGLDKLFIELIDHFSHYSVVDHGWKSIGCLRCFLEHNGVLLLLIV